jgi:uncharacterized RmlC-like cupin family protein
MDVRVVKPLQFDDHVPQTTGMRRLAAISHLLVGSEALWAGVMLAKPNTASSVHHHGPLETVVYVLAGQSKVRWGSRLEHEVDLEPGTSCSSRPTCRTRRSIRRPTGQPSGSSCGVAERPFLSI